MGKNKNRRLPNIVLLLISLFAVLPALEICFRYIFIQTNGMDVTLSNSKWLERHWKPINSFGLRDHEYTEEYLRGKKPVFVVGDSFAAGVGIEDIKDRFGSILGSKLGNGFTVLNLAQRGWSTDDELAALAEFPYKPDIVVLWYYVNDIEGAAAKYDIFYPAAQKIYELKNSDNIFHLIRRHSYLIDFLYWRLYPLSIEKDSSWWSWLRGLYDDPLIWATHQEELDTMVAYARFNKAKLYVVILPNLLDVRGSLDITGRVERFFTDKDIKTINLAQDFLGIPAAKLVVNSTDAHPGGFVHAFAAEKAYQAIVKDGGILLEHK